MKDYSSFAYHPMMEKIVDILRKKTQNEDPIFFRLMVSYFFCKLASMMRCSVQVAESQTIPINMYAINLAPSGSGKGHSINIIEDQVINQFRSKFLEETFPTIAERNITKLALKRVRQNGSPEEEELLRAQMEFDEMGALLFSFDSATAAALKQMRTKLLMGGAGSMNLEIDEIGSNLLGQGDALTTYLELFDVGKIKQKLIKNTRESVRSEDLFGSTPTNMLLFGTPTKLLNGSKTEEEFYDFLEIGYARRCFFGFCRFRKTKTGQTAQDIYDIYNDTKVIQFLATVADNLGQLADGTQFGQTIQMKKDVSLALFEYRLHCQNQADALSEYEEVQKAEISHRYFKVAKLAAAYAFIDRSAYVTKTNLENAIAMAEQSGIAFNTMMRRDRPHVKICNYLAMINTEVTQADLVDDLPFFKGTVQQRNDLLNLATAHGYKNGTIICRDIVDGIEFLSGKALPQTDLNKLTLSVSKDIVTGYATRQAPFTKLFNMMTVDGWHWVTHGLRDAYRDEEHVIPGFNLAVLDVENSISIDTAKLLLSEYKWLLHTTKRHTNQEHRFRIIIPLSHTLDLGAKDYKGFMHNLFDWLPFEVDRATAQRARKWLTCKGTHVYNDGELLDALQFVPKTKKAEQRAITLSGQTNFSNLERWFINNTSDGNRSNQLIKYSYALLDMGQDVTQIQVNVMALNSKLAEPLEEAELLSTVIASVTRRATTKGTS